MAYSGIVCLLLGVTVGTILYYMFGTDEQEQHQHHTGSRHRGSNDYYENNYSSYSDGYHDRRRGSSGLRDLDCTICLNLKNGRKIVLQPCKHVFHKECIEEWKHKAHQKSCPNCRCPFE